MPEVIDAPKFFGPMLIVRDFKASLRFYRDVVGLTGDGASPYAEFSADGWSKLVILDSKFWKSVGGVGSLGGRGSKRTGNVLAIRVPDVDKAYRRLKRIGKAPKEPPSDRPQMGLRNLQIFDPDGNVVEIYSELTKG